MAQLNSHLEAFSGDMPYVFFFFSGGINVYGPVPCPYFEGTGVIIMMSVITGCVEVFEARSWPLRGHFCKVRI